MTKRKKVSKRRESERGKGEREMSKDRKFTLTECFFCSHTPLSNTYILAAMEMKTHTHSRIKL